MMKSEDDRRRSLLAVAAKSGSKNTFCAVLDALEARLEEPEVRPRILC